MRRRGSKPFAGSHPVPSAESERAGRRALALAGIGARRMNRCCCCLSGGGSAIMAVPAEGVTLDDKRRTTDRLLKAGADIYALNTVRKHISAIKGGWLAAGASGAVPHAGDLGRGRRRFERHRVGTGVPDASTFDDAIAVLRRFGGLDAYPPSVVARLLAGREARCARRRNRATRVWRAPWRG